MHDDDGICCSPPFFPVRAHLFILVTGLIWMVASISFYWCRLIHIPRTGTFGMCGVIPLAQLGEISPYYMLYFFHVPAVSTFFL
jgi:hypothetical protein